MPRPRRPSPSQVEIRRGQETDSGSAEESEDSDGQEQVAFDGSIDQPLNVSADVSMLSQEADDDLSSTRSVTSDDEEEAADSNDSFRDDATIQAGIQLENLSSKAIFALFNILTDRLSNKGAERALLLLDNVGERKSVTDIIRTSQSRCSIDRLCHTCGKLTCDHEKTVVVYNFDILHQLIEFWKKFENEVNGVHRQPRGTPLESPGFAELKRMDDDEKIYVSLLLSADGVSIRGHTQKKLWVYTARVLDLRGKSRTSTQSIHLLSIVECDCDPTPELMSAVIFKINHQLQLCDDCIPSSARRPIFRVTNFSADQPAKRLIFNFVHYSSPKSCFFCLDGGTRYKDRGADRATVREGQKSLDDESAATNGFRGPSAGQRTVFVYHSLIDSLHDFGEGLCRDLLNEAFIFPVQKRKSNHFEGNLSAFHLFLRRLHLPADLRLPNEIQQCNGYTREQLFFTGFCCYALEKELGTPLGRVSIVALAVIMLINYNRDFMRLLHLLDLACNVLGQTIDLCSTTYKTIKAHEIIFHTPDIVRRFGPLPDYSTFGFEALYHHLLSNFKSTITNSFLKIAGTRFCLWKAVLNELLIRFENEPTADLRSYIATLPHWKNFVNNNWTVFGGKINNDTKAALPDKVRKGMSASRDRPILVPKKQFSSSERDGPRNKMPKIDDNDQPFTSTLLRPIPSPIPVIQQVLLKNQADSGLQLEDLIEDDSGHTVSPLIERLQRAPKTNDSTGSKQERKRRKTKNGEMTKLDPFKLACEFLLNENFEQVPFENVKGRFIDKMRGSSSVCIDSIVARALKATDVEHAEFLMLLAGALMILSGKIEETEHKQKSRKDKAKPNENKFFLTQFVDEKAVKQLGPLPTQIHLYSTLEANIGTAALAQGLPASTSLTAIISKFTKTILHEVIKPLDDAPFLTCSDSNKKYIQLHPDFLQAITEVVEASTHMVEILHDDDEYRKQHGLIYDSVCKQTATFLDHRRKEWLRTHTQEEALEEIKKIKARYEEWAKTTEE